MWILEEHSSAYNPVTQSSALCGKLRSPRWECIKAVVNDLAIWSGTWKEMAQTVSAKEVLGRGMWMDMGEWAESLRIFVSHLSPQQKSINCARSPGTMK